MTYVFLDFETTGLDTDTCHITEIGAVKTNEYGDVVGTYGTLVKLPPGETVPEIITELTGITDEMLETQGIDVDEAMAGLDEFINNSTVIAQYAPFDIALLERHREVEHFFDTRTMGYHLGLPKAGLKDLAAHYGIDLTNHHRATDDAMACKEIFFNLVEEIGGSTAGELKNVVGTRPERMPKKFPEHTIAVVDYTLEKEGE